MSLPLQHSRRIPLARTVAETLRDMIVRGELAPGSRIIERAVCARIQVSRTPMREALKLLEAEGLVELSQHKGARIMSFSETEARDLFEVIAGMESLAAELAATRLDSSGLARLEAMHSDMLGFYGERQIEPYFSANTEIHDFIVKASCNPVLIDAHQRLTLRARRGRYMAIIDPARWTQSVGEHEGLMKAFRQRDPEAARVIWRAHLDHTGDTVVAVLRHETDERSQAS
jgi:DNA-binding GntR family transcriptional regulator